VRHYFFDASAVVKLYVAEPGSNAVRDMVRSAVVNPPSSRVFRCDLSLPETFSALQQIERSPNAARRGMSRSALRALLPRVRADFAVTSPTALVRASDCMPLAAEIVARHRLRPADAVQLAAALRLKALLPLPDLQFVSSDEAQCRAAEDEGLEVLRPAA
jgi:predicted nucleic acid-binding protein